MRRPQMQSIFSSYLKHLSTKIIEAGKLANRDVSAQLNKVSSLPCWTFSSTNWSSYSLVHGCLPTTFLDVLIELDIL
ncbi:unnamed protein product [Rhizophagus irregularis]|nr:unnamed protein product [Rhizophagus irregularis]